MDTDVVIIGAGASGLMAGMEAGKRGRRVHILDHGSRPGRKILISGGGCCNFTNRQVAPQNYVSHNPHFCKSALSRFNQHDFLALVQKHEIPYEEREHGQLFCRRNARDILDMLLAECRQAGVRLDLGLRIECIEHAGPNLFRIITDKGTYQCHSLIVACGGPAMPSAGATPLGYKIAEQFGLKVRPPSAGLVPFTLQPADLKSLGNLAGISLMVEVSNERQQFRDHLLFTHRGLSGPASLQLSLYWQPGQTIHINWLPDVALVDLLKENQQRHPRRALKTALAERLPQRLVDALIPVDTGRLALRQLSRVRIKEIADQLRHWAVRPGGTEGYRTAEVTLGGVDCDAVSSKTLEAKQMPGLFFCGEVLDVTGQLGGYNLQWAWSSGWVAGQYA